MGEEIKSYIELKNDGLQKKGKKKKLKTVLYNGEYTVLYEQKNSKILQEMDAWKLNEFERVGVGE